MTKTEAVLKFLRSVSDAYIIDQQAKGMYASGLSAKTLKEVTDPDGGKLFGKGYWHFQKVGRRPGKLPPIDAIIQWIKAKGLTPEDGDVRSFAFAIARKIAKSGTQIFQKKRPGIDIKKELLEARKVLAVDYGGVRKAELIQKLQELKQASAEIR